MSRFLTLLFALIIGLANNAALAQSQDVGFFCRPGTGALLNPVANKTVILDSSTGYLQLYIGSGIWRKITPPTYNLVGIGVPGVSNDNTQGYAIGSLWFDTNGHQMYVCLDASTGAASWNIITNRGKTDTVTVGGIPGLFTTTNDNSTANSTASFAKSTFSAHYFYGNSSGSTAAPDAVQPAFSDLSGSALAAQLPITVVYKDGSNTYSGTQTQDFSAAGTTLRIPNKSDPGSPATSEMWVVGALFKYRDAAGSPATHVVANTDTGNGFTASQTPATAGGVDVGSAALPWRYFYLGSNPTNNMKLSAPSITAPRTCTFPDADCNPVIPDTGASHYFLTGVTSGGVISKAQPTFPDIAGTLSNSQLPTSGVSAGTYTNATVTFNAQGIATSASNGSTGAVKFTPIAKSGNFTASDPSCSFYQITASGAIAVTLPASPADGTIYKFKRVSGSGVITFTANGAETIDAGGDASTTLIFDNAGVIELIAVSGGWQVT